jgi:hypothetical protein
MPRTKLTQHAIAKLQAPTGTGKQIPYWDTDLTGFGVLCSGKTSAKSFIVQRDLPGGKSRRVTIANVSELKFADAKDRARKLLLDMRGGKDPKAKPRTGTLQETLDLYLASERLSPRSKHRRGRRPYMAAPERFAKRQIPLAPRAPSIHGPLRQFAVTQQFRRFRSEADIERAAKLACDAGWLRASRSRPARSPTLSTAGTMRFGNQPHRRGVCIGALRLTGLFPV